MDLLSRIVAWLTDHEAAISAVAAILAIAVILFTGLRFLLRRRAEVSAEFEIETPIISLESEGAPTQVSVNPELRPEEEIVREAVEQERRKRSRGVDSSELEDYLEEYAEYQRRIDRQLRQLARTFAVNPP